MNVASKELCQELYELSGWDHGGFLHTNYGALYITQLASREDPDVIAPAYDLGYLLRKLPKRVPGDIFSGVQLMTLDDTNWGCRVNIRKDNKHDFAWGVADTPEDAACKLSIELFKQGVLTKAA